MSGLTLWTFPFQHTHEVSIRQGQHPCLWCGKRAGKPGQICPKSISGIIPSGKPRKKDSGKPAGFCRKERWLRHMEKHWRNNPWNRYVCVCAAHARAIFEGTLLQGCSRGTKLGTPVFTHTRIRKLGSCGVPKDLEANKSRHDPKWPTDLGAEKAKR